MGDIQYVKGTDEKYRYERYLEHKEEVYNSYDHYSQKLRKEKSKKSCNCAAKYTGQIQELENELGKLTKIMKALSERSPDREIGALKKEKVRFMLKLEEKDKLILQLLKENADLLKVVAKMKPSESTSANNSTENSNITSKDQKTSNECIPTSILHPDPNKSREKRSSIERNYTEDGTTNAIHPRSSSIALIRPAKNIDSTKNPSKPRGNSSMAAEKPYKKEFRRSFLEVGIKPSNDYLDKDLRYKGDVKRSSYIKKIYKEDIQCKSPKKSKYRANRASDVKKPGSKISLYKNKVFYKDHNQDAEGTPDPKSSKQKKRMRQSMQTEDNPQLFTSAMIMSEQKEDLKRIMLNQDTIPPYKNNKRGELCSPKINTNFSICSLQKKRNQRKTWQKRA
ncbi:unnamed protein product [Moneuplotes crassus]|uniref:Uncharacterized protein n=1 Tax=Euplotes crassus TaxID=5936 RepID=A0AAD1XBC6_EUPCR|nr:unnamed protein product [Moneuplotes crassus]